MILSETLLTPSFNKEDLTLLLSESKQSPVSVEEKERLVASGGHYSDVFVEEHAMSDALHVAYEYALKGNNGAKRLAYHIQYLSHELISKCPDNGVPLVLISLVRAGVPLGVLLARHIRKYYPSFTVYHYGISIIRGRGIDNHALQSIHDRHPDGDCYFVDGWTGKGSISIELSDSLKMSTLPFDYRLVVDSDPAGTASLSATKEDWLIPFGLVGAQISGLFSRTLWSHKGYHKAALFAHLADNDIAQSFLDEVEQYTATRISAEEYPNDGVLQYTLPSASEVSATEVVRSCKSTFNLDSVHKIKPGIAEATRAVHRRTPAHIILRSEADPETIYLERLAKEKGIDLQIGLNGGMGPFRAITILS